MAATAGEASGATPAAGWGACSAACAHGGSRVQLRGRRRDGALGRWSDDLGNLRPHSAAAGLPRIEVHGPRHTHAALMLLAGVHPTVVQERLGHSSIATTLDTFSHALPAIQEYAADPSTRPVTRSGNRLAQHRELEAADQRVRGRDAGI